MRASSEGTGESRDAMRRPFEWPSRGLQAPVRAGCASRCVLSPRIPTGFSPFGGLADAHPPRHPALLALAASSSWPAAAASDAPRAAPPRAAARTATPSLARRVLDSPGRLRRGHPRLPEDGRRHATSASSTSFGASGDQSRAVEAGLDADVVSFSIEPDVTRLVKAGLVDDNWKDNADQGIVTNSVVSFIVRKGNPKGIRTWDDLLKPGVEVLTPNPFTSGAAKWNLLAAYGQAEGRNLKRSRLRRASSSTSTSRSRTSRAARRCRTSSPAPATSCSPTSTRRPPPRRRARTSSTSSPTTRSRSTSTSRRPKRRPRRPRPSTTTCSPSRPSSASPTGATGRSTRRSSRPTRPSSRRRRGLFTSTT